LNVEELEEGVRSLVTTLDKESFVYDLLLAYGQPKASISRLKKGDYNRSKNSGEVVWKKKLAFKHETTADLHEAIDRLQNDAAVTKHHPRFIVVTDFKTLLAVDTKTSDSLDTPIAELANHFDFFLPWAGLEKTQLQSENPADIKAAVKMGRLYDLILENNPPESDADRHALNIFLSRLLFCFFAEDTDIFASGQFTNAVGSHTADDGNDLQPYLQKLFSVLSTEDRSQFSTFLQKFPYVNGGLFADEHPVPTFNKKSRKIILECGELNWKAINPDIFGSMIQAVVHPDQRGGLGMHYTSVVNIMKVIEPLFLNDLKDELEKAANNRKKLEALLERLYRLRIFDPACGSGNFLIIAYKELCKLEIEIFKRLHGNKAARQTSFRFENKIQLQFYGIELDDFAHETSKLSLWLAEHQMNVAFKAVFGSTRPTLPLQDGGHIVCGNATRLNWEEVCPNDVASEIYILGNPPYLGARNQSKEQKSDMAHVFNDHKDFKDSDYVCCWFLKGVKYIQSSNATFAFVSTNSICQGEQVAYLWTRIFTTAEIGFAHKPLKWTNNAKGNAGVTCVILGIRNESEKQQLLYSNGIVRQVKNISPYLHDGNGTIVHTAKQPLSAVPKMVMGNMPRDGGHLILSANEAEELRNSVPESQEFIRRYYGANELLHSKLRYCLWISDDRLDVARNIPQISERIKKVETFRLKSRGKTTNQYSLTPHMFAQRSYVPGDVIVIPRHSSERRDYIPFGYLPKGIIVSDAAQVIYRARPFVFALICSRMHMVWCKRIGGALETRIRYSSGISYNAFPFPVLSASEQDRLETHTFRVLDEREAHPERSLSELYDPAKMPRALREAHHELDLEVEKRLRPKPFRDDDDRIAFLLGRYEEMIEEKRNAEVKNA